MLGGLGQGQAEVVVEDEDRALLRRQAPEAALERIALDDGDVVVSLGRDVEREDANVVRHAATPSGLPIAGVDEEAVQPGVEALDVSKRRAAPPGEDERLLDGVLREPEIAQDPVRDREESITSPTCQAGERLFVSGSRSLDEGNLHPRLLLAMRPTWTPTLDEPHGRPVVRCSRGLPRR